MKNVLVAGGAGGIGSSVVRELHENGYNPIILDIDKNRTKSLQDELGLPDAWCLDVTDVQSLIDKRDALDSNFKLDAMVLLAGRAMPTEWKPFEQQDIKEIQKSIQTNLVGYINVIHTFLPTLKKSHARTKSITIISSINAFGKFGLPVYSAAKFGLMGLVKALCTEYGKSSIRINSIFPGTIKTPATEAEPKDFEGLLETTATGIFATKEEIAKTVRFIIETNGITGQNIVIDSGQNNIAHSK